jgi:ABC-type microcin C transport system duplicated ATPase subunit YejF
MAYRLIAHNLAIVRYLGHRIAVLCRGNLSVFTANGIRYPE